MAEFLIGVVVGGLLLGWRGNSRSGFDFGAWLRACINRKRYERLAKRATASGFGQEFQVQWRIHSACLPFALQTGLESIRAYRRAEKISKQGTA